jgi:hypothetical protein
MRCHCCGASLPQEAKVCASCGARLVCPHCDTILPWPPYYASGCEYCPHCGTRLANRPEKVSSWNCFTVGCLIVIIAPLALIGTCFLIIAYDSYAPRSQNQRHGIDISAVAILAGTVVLSILAIVAIEKLRKKKKRATQP